MAAPNNDQLYALIRGLNNRVQKANTVIIQLQQVVSDLAARPRSVQEEIDSIPGRRIESTLCGSVAFTAADEGQRGAPIIFPVSQDGDFVQTHYPLCLWIPTAPDSTTNLNRWRPVSTFPLPTQVVSEDIIDIMYEMQDGGNQRLFQNEARGPLLSRPDNIVPTPVPTLWAPGTTINFVPTYLSFTWDSDVPPTAGELHVTIPGYRIVNL
jgi:hypothetical protein